MIGNFTGLGVLLALSMLVSLLIGMSAREYARAFVATRLHDPTPRLWGRLSLNPRSWFDGFGSGFIPGLIGVLWAANAFVTPAAYAKPAPIDPGYFRRYTRDVTITSLAGPLTSLALGMAMAVAVRLFVPIGDLERVLVTFAYTNCALFVFHLLPIPGLDGARLVGLLLPPQAREVYRNADKYLPLIVLLVLFLFGTLLIGLLEVIGGAFCNGALGESCRQVMTAGSGSAARLG